MVPVGVERTIEQDMIYGGPSLWVICQCLSYIMQDPLFLHHIHTLLIISCFRLQRQRWPKYWLSLQDGTSKTCWYAFICLLYTDCLLASQCKYFGLISRTAMDDIQSRSMYFKCSLCLMITLNKCVSAACKGDCTD